MSVEDLTLSVEEGELAGVAEPELKPNAMGFAVPAAGSAESPRSCSESSGAYDALRAVSS